MQEPLRDVEHFPAVKMFEEASFFYVPQTTDTPAHQ